MPVRVTATSFLPPDNRSWDDLRSLGQVEFGQYGDWGSVLLSGDAAQPVLWVLFLEDLIAPGAAGGDPAPLLEPMLASVSHRLAKATAPTLVAFSSWRPDSPIRASRAPTAWQTLGRALAAALEALAVENPSLRLLDLDSALAVAGLDSCFDARNFYVAHCRLSARGMRVLASSAAAILGREKTAAKKVLVLDCDNTLWGGVVGEVGLGGIALGQDGMGSAFVDFQREVKRLAGEGVILAVASKNNDAEAWEVFDKHAAMVLKRADIVAARIDWREKPGNLAAIADELDLGLDSFVFWDDNPLEREKMRAALPQVLTPEVPPDVIRWPSFLAAMDAFARPEVTAEDRKKTAQYKSRAEFMGERGAAMNEGAFLRSINLVPRVVPIDAATLGRAAQLCAKTNQFNLRTRRHGEAAIKALAALTDHRAAFLAALSDRFGDHGIVGLAIAQPTADKSVAFLDTFLMSCRILGRHMEAWMLASVAARLRERGAKWLVAEYVPTGRNAMCEGFLAAHGLKPLDGLADKTMLAGATMSLTAGGTLYAAALDGIAIPYLDVFAKAPAAAQ